MADIFHYFPIKATAAQVYRGIATPEGLTAWWTLTCQGTPKPGSEYELGFGPEYNWKAVVSRCVPDREFELEITDSMDDWRGTKVGFKLEENQGITEVQFHHAGWPTDNEHYRTSCYCWAMYLRLLKRNVEHGETVPYENRLDA